MINFGQGKYVEPAAHHSNVITPTKDHWSCLLLRGNIFYGVQLVKIPGKRGCMPHRTRVHYLHGHLEILRQRVHKGF